MLAQISFDPASVDFTDAKVTRSIIKGWHGDVIMDQTDTSFQDLRKIIFQSIETETLLSGMFPSITDDPQRGMSFRKNEFCGWMCRDNYKYDDGECIYLYIRNSSANEVMRDVIKALDGDTWAERAFKFMARIDIRLADGRKVRIEV
jgi:hypothetical protein